MMKTRIYLLTILLLICSVTVFGQKERKFIRQGNRYYKKAVENSDSTRVDSLNFSKAEIDYRKALDKKPGDFKSQYNIGNALFKQNKMAESSSQYEQIIESATTKEDKGKTWFNYGNSMLGQKKLDESIDAYKNALRNNPKDLEAKYNLEFARKLKQQQQQQQKQQNKDQNKDNKDQNKDQQNKDQNKDQNKQNQDQNKQNQDQNKQNQDQNKQQQQPKISRQNAEQMLKALQNDERQTQEKVKKAQAVKAQSNRPDQDW